MRLSDHPYAPFLHRVRSPSRYVGGEFGAPVQDPSRCRASMVLVFPDAYEVGMSHLGSQVLMDVVAREPDLCLERCFAPWPDLEAELRARGLPLVTLETFSPLRDFDVVGFSLQHELSYTNVLNVLDLSGIPLRAAARSDADPIVLGGGPCATHPAPVAPFFDAFFIGEAEDALPGLLREVGGLRRAGAPRDRVLRALATRPGVLVPSLRRLVVDRRTGFQVPDLSGGPPPTRRQVIADLDRVPVPVGAPMPWSRAVFDRASIEIARGCTEGCRFCEAGYTYRPLRERGVAALVRQVVQGVDHSGLDEVSLCALSPADSPVLGPLVRLLSGALTPRGVTLSVSSLRAYGVSDEVLRDLRRVRAAGLTLAPEAGSERLRDVINKNVRDEDLLAAAQRAFSNGWHRLKLYFMIGLPTETDDDVRAIARLARAVQRIGRSHTPRARVTASVGLFVPRPHTPFQWEGMAPDEVLAGREALLRAELRGSRVDLKVADRGFARLECALARGDARVADVVEAAFRRGCRFDSWDDLFRREGWAEAFAAAGVDPEAYARPIPLDAGLPWDDVDVLVRRDFLRRERERAYRGAPLPPCEKPPVRRSPAAGEGGPSPESPRTAPRRPGPGDYESARTVICYRCGAPCDPKAIAEGRSRLVREADAVIASGAGARGTAAASGEAARGVTEEPSFWHLVFTKVGRAAWLSQKDLVAHFPRILRRAGLRLDLSRGFHPLPRLSYRPPMPVGYQGVGEWVVAAVFLPEGVAPDLGALNRASVEGIEFLRAVRLPARRLRPGPTRYIFRSDGRPGDLDLPGWLRAREAKDPGPRVAACLDPARGPYLTEVDWPDTGRPPLPLHDLVAQATGAPYTPHDFVRLYDDPVANPPAASAKRDAVA